MLPRLAPIWNCTIFLVTAACLLYTEPDLNCPFQLLQKCSYYSTELSRGYLCRYIFHFSGWLFQPCWALYRHAQEILLAKLKKSQEHLLYLQPKYWLHYSYAYASYSLWDKTEKNVEEIIIRSCKKKKNIHSSGNYSLGSTQFLPNWIQN